MSFNFPLAGTDPARRARTGDVRADRRQATARWRRLYPTRRHRRAVPDQPRHGPPRHPARQQPAHACAPPRRSSSRCPGSAVPLLRRGGRNRRTGRPVARRVKRTPMPWDATPGGGFTTGTPVVPVRPGPRRPPTSRRQSGDPSLPPVPLPHPHPRAQRLRSAAHRRDPDAHARPRAARRCSPSCASAPGERVLVVPDQ
ncbi:MAG: hypothetical protein MZV64_25070 [Ignavibacteriales bacterium]|nr:hypothetical protein [Ignavibacteriales bacterium]